jgi:predicted RNA-binding Zn-ribbon protein involved in translation (DUF1610 family)
MYEDCKVYGPYLRRDGRQMICIIYADGRSTTTQYGKYLLECSLNWEIPKGYDVHHKDHNKLNDDLENLEIIEHKEHCKDHATRNISDVQFLCPECGKFFMVDKRQQRQVRYNNIRQGRAGPFCSRTCAGHYGQKIQMIKRRCIDNDIQC